MSESTTQDIDVEEIKSTKEYQSLKERMEDLEEKVFDLQDRVESIQRRNDEQQFHEQSNFGY